MGARMIVGSGGGGGGGASRAPVESPDSLQSRQYARILDLVSEGPIEGLVAGAQSVFLDGVAVQNSDGSFNFNGVSFEPRAGTQDQTAIPGFNAVEAEVAVGVEVEYASSVTRTLTNPNLTAARVTLGVPQLTSQDPVTGDLHGTTVQLAIDVQTNGGGFVPLVLEQNYEPATYHALLHYRTPSNASGFAIAVRFLGYPITVQTGDVPEVVQGGNATVSVEYRLVGAPGWTTLATKTLTYDAYALLYGTEASSLSASLGGLAVGQYEFRVTPTDYLAIDFANAFLPTDYLLISGKTTTRYQRSYRIPLSGGGPWDIRVRRMTADSTTVNVRDNTWWDSLTEIIDQRLRYPNSALIALQADAAHFRTVPRRGYDLRGLLLQVPSNYNPADRSYTGIWDGTFQTLWSDNPAWVFYDLIANDRYGLGELIDPALIDKWTLYTVAQYCDELVPNGFGSVEPRCTCNVYLQVQEEAYKVITALASIFRAMVFWSGGGISCAQDAPQDPAALFANANVIDGVFNYQGSARTARHTIALVSWNDPADMYRAKIEYVEDTEGIARYGVRQTEVLAMGCTSRGQAHRLGRWLLYTERMETEVVSFRAGLDSVGCLPGEVIQIADAPRAGARMGGRLAACTTTSATLDAPVTLAGGESYTISLVTPEGSIVSRPVTTAAGTVSVLAWTAALASVPGANALWVLSASNLEPTSWRVLSVSEPEKNIVEVTALAYNASKFAAIEQDLALEIPPTSLVYVGPPLPVTGLTLSESMYREEPVRIVVRLTAGWTPPAMGLSGYDVRIRPSNGNWRLVRRTQESTIDIDGMTPGLWEVSVTAISTTGQPAPAVYSTINILGETVPPSDVTGFTATADDSGIHLDWDDSPDVDIGDYEIRYGASWAAATSLVFTKSTAWLDGHRAPGNHTYWIAARDLMGNLSVNPTSTVAAVTAASAPAVSATFSGGNCVLTWTPPASGSFAVVEYEGRYGADWASGVSLGKFKGTTHTLLAQWAGARNFWIAAYDLLGNVGAAGSVTAVVTPAAAPVLTSQGIDNNVLLYWSQVQGTLPTITYELRRGATWAGATLIGTKSGGFTTIFETASGSYTYWVAAVDSAGNYGTPASVAATVSQPPDYVLKTNYFSALAGTKSKLLLEDGSYLGPVDTTETFADHFTTRSWAGPADQIAAGYPIYAQPNASPAYYEETLDYGAVLASSKVTITANVQAVTGTVTPTCTISVSPDNSAWTDYTNVWEVYATNFRYVKVRVTLTAAGATDLCRLLGLNIRIDAKLKTHTAMLSCLSTDSGGTILYLTDDGTSGGAKLFIDVDAIQVSVQGTTPVTPVYDFTDAPDPLSLKVLLFNAAGARVSGTASITVRGF